MTDMRLECPDFADGTRIPTRFTEDGQDISPALRWSPPPPGTQELALIVDDPDAPTPEPWVHWLLYRIPATVTQLPEGIPKTERLDPSINLGNAVQGKNSWGTIGYRGPAPPRGHGVHRYHFKLYALSGPVQAPPGADKLTLERAMSGLVLARADYSGTYER